MNINTNIEQNKRICEDLKLALLDFFNFPWQSKDFLTEDDVRCRLYLHYSLKLKKYKNISIHSEIRWYGDAGLESGKLKYRSDVVVIDNFDLRDKKIPEFKLPSKGFGFNKYYCIIEIKLRRPNDKNSNEKYDGIIELDVRKLKKIKENTTGGGFGVRNYYVIVFDKKRKKKKLIINNENEINEIWDFKGNWEEWRN